MLNPFETIDSRLSNIENILLDLKRDSIPHTLSPTSGPPLTVPEASVFLSLSKQTIYKLLREKKIPCMKVPGQKRVYFLQEDLIAFLKTGRKKTTSEIQEEADLYCKNKKGSR